MPRPFVVERRPLPARDGARRPDDAAELLAEAAALQDLPRDALASMPDLLLYLRRRAKRIVVIAGRVGDMQAALRRATQPRAVRAPAVDPRAAAERAFSAGGKGRVRLPARAAGQMELGL